MTAIAFRMPAGSTASMGLRLVLIPGMGADERLFEPQRAGGLCFDVPRMPVPEPGDSMARYAARIRDLLDLREPCIVGGVSFGGMVACELGRLCPARKILLIASCCDGSAVPSYYRWAELVSRVVPSGLIRRRAVASSRILARLEHLTEEQYLLIREMSLDIPVPYLRRVGRMILGWRADQAYPVPIHAIHGQRDRIIPLKGVQPDVILPEGGHLINLTHAAEVNSFIRSHLEN